LSQAFGLSGLFVRADPRALPRAKLSQAFGLQVTAEVVCNDEPKAAGMAPDAFGAHSKPPR
jgi:hypothetical protein